MIKFCEHLKNKSNVQNNGTTSPFSQWESAGHAILIIRLIMLDTAISRSHTEWQWSIQMSQCKQSNAKYSVQSAQVKGGQLDLARFSSSHGIIVNFHIQGQTSPLIHTLRMQHSEGNIFSLLLCKLCEWLHLSLPDYMIKYKSDKKQCTEIEPWSSNNPLISPSKSNFNSILCLDRCSSLTGFDGNLQQHMGTPEIMQSDIATSGFVFHISLRM